MHKGNKVFVLPSRPSYHYNDGDCPVTASILKRKKKADIVTEDQAKAAGLKLCIHCRREYEVDRIEGPHKWIKQIYKMFT